jgi:putative endonuclease
MGCRPVFFLSFCHPELVEGSVPSQFHRMRDYFVYILSNNSQVLYIGVTSNLDGRMFEHVKERQPTSFVARYNLDRLVFYETYSTPGEAIAREKQLKGWNQERKRS